MPCLLALLALISPRLVLFLLWIFSDVLSHAFSSWILFFVVLAFIIDLGSYGGGRFAAANP